MLPPIRDTSEGQPATARPSRVSPPRPGDSLLGAVAVTLAWLAFVSGGALLMRALRPDLDQRQLAFALTLALAVVIAAAVSRLRWWRRLGFAAAWRNGRVLLLPLLLVLAPWLGGIRPLGADTILFLLAGYALTAFAEETVFRGVLFRLLGGRSPGRIVLVSSVLFGIVHLGNVLIRGNPVLVGAQAVGAATAGVGYASLYVLTGSIWAPIVIHLVHDLALNTTRLPLIPVDVAQDVVLLAYGTYLVWGTRAGREAPSPASGADHAVEHEE